MITKVTVRYFKQFESEVFDLSDHVILAGPNNSGKSTLLQAIVVWSLALQKWKLKRPRRAGAKQRSGIPITRKEFTAIPLREMNLLWTNTSTAMGRDEAEAGKAGKAGYPRVLEIALEGVAGDQSWEMPFEFTYSSSEQIHVKPAEKYLDHSPPALESFTVVHVPPFSGIGTEETRYDRPYQDLLIGQGKAGDILRNLLLDIHKQQGEEAWEELCQQVRDVFGYQLSPPRYEGAPFIVCEYLPGIPPKRGRGSLPRLERRVCRQRLPSGVDVACVFLRPALFVIAIGRTGCPSTHHSSKTDLRHAAAYCVAQKMPTRDRNALRGAGG